MRPVFAFLALILLGCIARPAAAANCSAYASSIAFGSYISSSENLITGTITVTCPTGVAFHIALNAGMGSGATVTNRKMSGSASATLTYGLFTDAARTINWGNSGGSNWVSGTGSGSAKAYNIYARLPAGQSVVPGGFTDTISASITSSLNTANAQFSVTATASPSCLVSATNLNFGTYTGALTSSTSTVTVTCSKSTTYNIGLNAGVGSGATVSNRKMTSPTASALKYALFRNSARTQNWGNTVGADTVTGTGTGSAQATVVYGQMAAKQFGNPAVYTDTIITTITY